MIGYWITFENKADKRRRPETRRRLLWPWQWFRRGSSKNRSRPRAERRGSLWPLLLLLLLLPLLVAAAWFFWPDGSSEDTTTQPAAPTDELEKALQEQAAAAGADDGQEQVSEQVSEQDSAASRDPFLPEADPEIDDKRIKLESISCGDGRYVLAPEGQAQVIEDLDDETLDQLSEAGVSVSPAPTRIDADISQTVSEWASELTSIYK